MPVTPAELSRELTQVSLTGALLLSLSALTTAGRVDAGVVLAWLVVALVCWALIIWQCRRLLPENRSGPDTVCQRSLGPANRVTLLRGLLIAASAGFLPLAVPQPGTAWIVALLYTLAASGDALDGYVARRQACVTELGARLDMTLDALGLLVAPLLAVLYGKLPMVYLLVSVAYYLFQWGLYWRCRQGRAVYALPPSRLRRHLAGLQMVLVALALWPPLPATITRPLAVLVMAPLLLGFWRDWLHVSGRRGTPEESVA